MRSESVSEAIYPIGKEVETSDWTENNPPFPYMEIQEEQIFPNAKRKRRLRKLQWAKFSQIFSFLPWRKKLPGGEVANYGFPAGTNPEKEKKQKIPRTHLVSPRSKPYFWEAWFPMESTLTISPLLVWESHIESHFFSDCLPEGVVPFGPPGKWKIQFYVMRIRSHQIGNLYEDFFPKPNLAYRAEAWVYGVQNGSEMDPENLYQFPLGVWTSPSTLQHLDPRIRQKMTFRSGELEWNILGSILEIRLRELYWRWKPSSEQDANIEKQNLAPHVQVGKKKHKLVLDSPREKMENAILYERSVISEPKLFQRSNPDLNRSVSSPNPIRR
ncbi:hypothetical protein [Leptospira perolatii]|uniref:hypothetical protein n=1 Tax=Leptospira perolatii TaxID=2023191 RepID=UPI000F643B0E|nr:hypothetical protein [Leptospira perolatii]